MPVTYPIHSLDDYLKSVMLDVDGQLDDGWGSRFSVKGRLLKAAILFADISGFSRISQEFSPIETLIYVNNYFAWMTAEGLLGTHGVVDKYIGDELMVVFAREFGSADPVDDALKSARWMVERDALGFHPKIGIACGEVVVGYVGTPLAYNTSVFGRPVTLASRCCSAPRKMNGLNSILIPTETWGSRNIETLFPCRFAEDPTKGRIEFPLGWSVGARRKEALKNIGDVEVIELCHMECEEGHTAVRMSPSIVSRIKENFETLQQQQCVAVKRFPSEPDSIERQPIREL